MVESTVYFEAYRHILEGLKEVDPAHLPLQVMDTQSRGYVMGASLFFGQSGGEKIFHVLGERF